MSDEVIDDDVARFRAFLDETDPTEFGTARGQDEPPPDEPRPWLPAPSADPG